MQRHIFFWGLLSGVMATVASLIWNEVYYFAFQISFPSIIHFISISAASIASCLVAVTGYTLLQRFLPKYGDIIFNFILSIITIASLVMPLSFRLPLDVSFPEMFPALTLPMHFFPAMALFTLQPLFRK